MLEPLEYRNVLQKLRDKTLEGRVAWGTVWRYRNRFECELDGRYKFAVWKDDDKYGVTMSESDGEDSLFSVEAEEQIRYPSEGKKEAYELLAEIFELARRSALDVPGKLATVANLLDKI